MLPLPSLNAKIPKHAGALSGICFYSVFQVKCQVKCHFSGKVRHEDRLNSKDISSDETFKKKQPILMYKELLEIKKILLV